MDGIVYNYLALGFQASRISHVTDAFDRTFEPQLSYMNCGKGGAILSEPRVDFEKLAIPEWNHVSCD